MSSPGRPSPTAADAAAAAAVGSRVHPGVTALEASIIQCLAAPTLESRQHLERFRAAADAWGLAPLLLSSSDTGVRLFAATVLLQKARTDLKQLGNDRTCQKVLVQLLQAASKLSSPSDSGANGGGPAGILTLAAAHMACQAPAGPAGVLGALQIGTLQQKVIRIYIYINMCVCVCVCACVCVRACVCACMCVVLCCTKKPILLCLRSSLKKLLTLRMV